MKYIALLFMFFLFSLSAFSQENKEMEETLLQMLEQEQTVRKNMSAIYSEWSGKEEFEYKRDSVIAVMLQIDSVNQHYIANLLDMGEWPDSLSRQANMAIFMIIQHSPSSYMDKYASLVKEAYNKGYIEPRLYAIFEDRYLMRQNKAQLYGSQIMNGYVWPIEDLESLDVRRKEMNLSSHQEYLNGFRESGMEVIWDKDMTVDDLVKILGFSPKDLE